MLAKQPQVAEPGNRYFRQRWRSIGFLVVFERQKPVDLARIKSGEAEIEIGLLDLLEFERQKLLVPIRPGNRGPHGEGDRTVECP